MQFTQCLKKWKHTCWHCSMQMICRIFLYHEGQKRTTWPSYPVSPTIQAWFESGKSWPKQLMTPHPPPLTLKRHFFHPASGSGESSGDKFSIPEMLCAWSCFLSVIQRRNIPLQQIPHILSPFTTLSSSLDLESVKPTSIINRAFWFNTGKNFTEKTIFSF